MRNLVEGHHISHGLVSPFHHSIKNTLRIPPVCRSPHLKALALTPLQQNGKALKVKHEVNY